MNYKVFLIILLTVILAFVVAGSVLANLTDTNPEYHQYVHIRDFSNCTMSNDTYCTGRSGCVHAYDACQRDRCHDYAEAMGRY